MERSCCLAGIARCFDLGLELLRYFKSCEGAVISAAASSFRGSVARTHQAFAYPHWPQVASPSSEAATSACSDSRLRCYDSKPSILYFYRYESICSWQGTKLLEIAYTSIYTY